MTNKQNIILQQQISITYTNVDGKTVNSIDSENIFKASVYQWFPIINADGELKVDAHVYDLYIGREIDIDTGINAFKSEVLKVKFITMKENGYKKVVIPYSSTTCTPLPIYPIQEKDRVYATKEQLLEAISKITLMHQTIDISFNNSNKGEYKY